ncbi:oligosaccharide flippase family protein [Patescibacteria group bacterium]|nr:oligosaccharide flippase family protein [Patescibacteria group bacterium]
MKKLLESSIFSGVLVVTVGSFIGSAFSYLLQIFLGRTLSLEDYGTFNTLLSFSTILGVLGGAFSNSVIKRVSALKAECRFDTLTLLFWRLSFYCLLFGALFSLVLIALRSGFAQFFNISNTQVLVSFSVLMGLTFLGSLPRAYLQGLLRFKALAFWSVFAAFTRLVFPVGAVFAHLGLPGVFYGMVLGSIASFLISIALLNKNFESCNKEQAMTQHYRQILKLVGPIVFIQVGLTLLNNMDVILVKRLFDPESAGIYAGVVTIGKVLLFGAGAIGTIMFPVVAEAFSLGQNYKKALNKFLPLQLVFVLGSGVVFAFFPRFITLLMFGERFLPAVDYIPLFTFFISFYIMVNFFILYFMAIEKFLVTYILGGGVLLQVLLIWKFATSLNGVVLINSAVTLVVLILLVSYYAVLKSD